jgi:DNA-binding response OmpR family regulator
MTSYVPSDDGYVLLVDAEPRFLSALQLRLRNQGLAVRSVQTGESAIELVRGSTPLLAIIDFTLPGALSGLKVAEALGRQRAIPTVFYSLTAGDEYQRAAAAVGAAACLSKELDLDVVVARVRAIVAATSPRAAARANYKAAGRAAGRRDFLAGVYSARFNTTPEQMKSILNRFSRRNNLSLDALAEMVEYFETRDAQLRSEYERRRKDILPPMLQSLMQFAARELRVAPPVVDPAAPGPTPAQLG